MRIPNIRIVNLLFHQPPTLHMTAPSLPHPPYGCSSVALFRRCTSDEIRSEAKATALQWHPDKLEAKATALNAYKVLLDVRERARYGSHRSQILFSDDAWFILQLSLTIGDFV
ncbi:hypothetical protein E3N88_35961 [Mikania micrantha]|uniref:J domain-containing protein n=1 Tax=Mikania micrantha TaxID=192012 RepID=A0A5N6M2X6_9ASTR|nr:hypothetical protein E3N88_35961 [Mikania micrantha]